MTQYNFLVVSDTNNIVDYIFASNKYKFIRGASLLLDYLNTTKSLEVIKDYNGEYLSLGGGEARVLFATEQQAKGYAAALQKLYIDKTDEVTLSIAVVAREKNESMAVWIGRAEQKLRLMEIKEGKKQLHTTLLLPIMKRCDTCYKRAAEKYSKIVNHYVCKSCFLKLAQYTNVTQHLKDKKETELFSGIAAIHQCLQDQDLLGGKWNATVEQLFEGHTGEIKMGFVYLDGKNIGALFKQINNDEEIEEAKFIETYKGLSENLQKALVQSAVEAHKKLKDLYNEDLPINYALVGGDDIAAAMPAHFIFLYTYFLMKSFEELTEGLLKEQKSLAGGIVIAKKNYPMHTLFNLAYELMARTKSRNTVGTVDFQIVLDSNVQSIDFKRSESPINKRHLYAEGYCIQDRPYSFLDLYKTAYRLKSNHFPSSKIKAVYQMTTELNDDLLQFNWKEWFVHLPSASRKILNEWHPLVKTTPFFLEQEGRRYTPLRDLFDLYDFIDLDIQLEALG